MNLLAAGIPGMTPSDEANPGGEPMSLDALKDAIQAKISQDPFLMEQAPRCIAWQELGDPEKVFVKCTTAAEVAELETSILKNIGNSKTAVAALRRTMKDTKGVGPGLGTRERPGVSGSMFKGFLDHDVHKTEFSKASNFHTCFCHHAHNSCQDCTQMVKSVQKARQRYQDQLARIMECMATVLCVFVCHRPDRSGLGPDNGNNIDNDDMATELHQVLEFEFEWHEHGLDGTKVNQISLYIYLRVFEMREIVDTAATLTRPHCHILRKYSG